MDFKQPHRRPRPQVRPQALTNHRPPLTISRPIVEQQQPATPRPATPRRKQLPLSFSKRQVLLATASIVILVAIALLLQHALVKTPRSSVNTTEKPAYQTISPAGQSVNELGGWRRVSPPNGPPVYSYDDSIDSVSISVSQQPLPSSFQNNVDSSISQLAKAYNATNKLTADSTTVYIGTSAKGPQSVIFTKDNLLVLIKSQSTISNQAWKQYVTSLVRSGVETLPQY